MDTLYVVREGIRRIRHRFRAGDAMLAELLMDVEGEDADRGGEASTSGKC